MTDKDIAQQYGEAMISLKKAKTELAAAQTQFSTYMEELRINVVQMETFAKDPLAKDAQGRPWADYSYAWKQKICREDFTDVVHAVFAAANRVKRLQAQVEAFDS